MIISEKEKRKINKKKNIKEWFLLITTFNFMLSVFAPIEAYYSNKNEFWFGIWQIVGVAAIVFIIVEAVLIIIFGFLYNTKIAPYYYVFLTFLMIYVYIQGNYIPRNYGVLNGTDILWNQYAKYGVASVVLAVVCLILCGIVIWKFEKLIFKLGSCLSIFIFTIQVVTLLTFAVRDVITLPDNSNIPRVVTDNRMFELSENNNIIVFVLDTFDGAYFNDLLDTDYITYSNILKDFTYYKDTLGAYPTTKGALPNILTGVWYENEQPYAAYVESAYVNNNIYKCFNEKKYSVGIYTSELYLSSDIHQYENVELGTYKIKNKLDFINSMYKIVAFNYVPHQWKRWFYFDSSEFESLKESTVGHSAYSADVKGFEDKLNKEGITVSKMGNCFRLYHLDGVHPPYTFGKDLTTNADMIYDANDEAAGNCMLLKEYFSQLMKSGVYDNATIVIMADHGSGGYAQNPIFLIKNRNETHDFKISDVAMSYEYLPDIWIALINGKVVDETFIKECTEKGEDRRFLYYAWDNSWDRDYLPTMSEMFAKGIANEMGNMVFTGTQYKSETQYCSYSLGTELLFTEEATANAYGTFGFSVNEGFGTWTNGSQSMLDFDIKGEDCNNLLLTIESNIFGTQQEVLIYANDHQVADVMFYGLEKKEFVIPNEYIKDGVIRITMEYPDAVAPHDIDKNSTDRRQLALSMRSVKLESTDRAFILTDQIIK